MKKQFPNGFASWQETHYEVVSEITTQLMLYFEQNLCNAVGERYEAQGRGGMYELAEELTDEFELLNKGRDWDGEFFDELESFLSSKFNLK